MKIDTKILRHELIKVLNEDSLSPEEVANKAGVSKVTIYRIINVGSEYTQRAIVRKIAEATGRDFKIDGDKVTFVKREKKEETYISSIDKELIGKFNQLTDEQQRIVLDLVGSLCRNRKTARGEDGSSRED